MTSILRSIALERRPPKAPPRESRVLLRLLESSSPLVVFPLVRSLWWLVPCPSNWLTRASSAGVVDDSDGDEDENLTDAEDPTITIGMTPRNGKVTKGAIVAKAPASELRSEASFVVSTFCPCPPPLTFLAEFRRSPIFSSPILLEDQRVPQRVTRARPFENLDSVEYLSSDPPFHNLDSRSESRASTTHSSTLSHSRSRSVLSFFTSATSPVSTASSHDSATPTKSSVLVKGPERKKKMGRIRRVVSKVFG